MNQPTRTQGRQLRLVFDRSLLGLEPASARRKAVINRLSQLLQEVVRSELNAGRMDDEREDHTQSS
jgi:hypothetical protein